jgi:hypothetical protein
LPAGGKSANHPETNRVSASRFADEPRLFGQRKVASTKGLFINGPQFGGLGDRVVIGPDPFHGGVAVAVSFLRLQPWEKFSPVST